MKSKTGKMLALILALSIVLSLGACGKKDDEPATTTLQDTAVNPGETAIQEGETTLPQETSEGETASAAEPEDTTATTVAAPAGLPVGDAQILAAYTAVMNQAKKDRPGYKKIEHQILPEEDINIGGLVGRLLPIANRYMTTEEKARKNPMVAAKGSNLSKEELPVKWAEKGCMLTDVNALKSANCTVLPNGNYKIVLMLKDEKNPEIWRSGDKAPSNIGAVFSPLAKSDVDKELQTSKLVKSVVKSAEYDLYYSGCTSTVVYNPKNNQVVSVYQYMYAFLDMKGDIALFGEAEGTAVLKMYYEAYDFTY